MHGATARNEEPSAISVEPVALCERAVRQLSRDIPEQFAMHTRMIAQDGQVPQSKLKDISRQIQGLRLRLDEIQDSGVRADQSKRSCECRNDRSTERTVNMTERKVTVISDAIQNVASRLDRIELVVIGRDNAEGLRSEYQRDAIAAARHRNSPPKTPVTIKSPKPDHAAPAQSTQDKPRTRRSRQRRRLQGVLAEAPNFKAEGPVELTILIPTFRRQKLVDNTEYLRAVLSSLVVQYVDDLAERPIRVVVVNNSPRDHTGIREAAKQVLDEHNATLPVVVTEGDTEFEDPFGPKLKLKVDLPGKPDLLESWVPSRLHCRHLVESFSKALKYPASYVLLWEDDMIMCGNSKNGTLRAALESIDQANRHSSNWTAIRLGFGGNGILFHLADIPLLSDYILANMHRKPPDWLMTEWYKVMTYTSEMQLGDRHRGFTHELNFGEHIGSHSSFPGREDQGKKESESHVNYEIPKCFDANWWLLPAERYNTSCSGRSSLSPCE